MNALVRSLVTLQSHAAHDFAVQTADHHAGAPEGAAEIVIVVVGVIITALVAFYTLKFFFRPGESGAGHIKRRILGGGR